jgi:hypothetical protein
MRIPLGLLICLSSLVVTAQDLGPIKPRTRPVPASGLFVPVSLEAVATDGQGLGFTNRHVQVGRTPFDVVVRDGVDNLFLNTAEWPKWREDPSRYYADYHDRSEGDPRRPMFRIPVADYQYVYLLAAAEDDEAFSQAVSFRIGAFDKSKRVTLHDFEAEVPRFGGKRTKLARVQIPLAEKRNLFVVQVPLGKAIAQDFNHEWAFDVEVTKKLRLQLRRPDPNRYQVRPLGLPSGVHIFGMTFMRSPVQMEVRSEESGHVFNEPAKPVFSVKLTNIDRRETSVQIVAEATDFYGQTTTVKSPEIKLQYDRSVTHQIEIPVPKRGWHSLVVRVTKGGRIEYLRRETSFALLPKDTRQYRAESPFGTWDFCGGHFTSSDPDAVGPLYVKAGFRYGMFNFSAEKRRQYGILAGNEPRSPELLTKKLALDPLHPKRVLIFHETAISGPHIMRTPDLFTGREAYQFDDTENEKFEKLWTQAHEVARETRKQYPEARLMFGNGNPHLLEAFVRRGFSKKLFDARGNEAGNFMRMPEAQPFDFVANNAGIWMDRQILDHYGYQDTPIWQCYEITYPGSNPGNLSLRTQAAYFVRHAMHSLAWGIPVIRQGIISDVGNSYYYSNWGASGFCHAIPELNAKPAFAAIATMTQVLDGAKFSRVIETGSPTCYALEFRRRDGKFVTAGWTLRGQRSLAVSPDDGRVVDMMGNEQFVETSEGRMNVVLSSEPVFITTAKAVTNIGLGVPIHAPSPKPAKRIATLNTLAGWGIESGNDPVLENYNFENPRLKGSFEIKPMKTFAGGRSVLSVKPSGPKPKNPYLPTYVALRHKKGIPLPERPTQIGLMVNGNGSWGRIIFELEDASGQTWTSIGAAQAGKPPRWMEDWLSPKEVAAMGTMMSGDWNTNDPWQRSRINFEGWRYVDFPLPGNYPGEQYHWPYSNQWRHTGDGIVHYPMKLTRLIVEMPQKVLHMREFKAVPRPEIYLRDLTVTHRAPEEAFVAE